MSVEFVSEEFVVKSAMGAIYWAFSARERVYQRFVHATLGGRLRSIFDVLSNELQLHIFHDENAHIITQVKERGSVFVPRFERANTHYLRC